MQITHQMLKQNQLYKINITYLRPLIREFLKQCVILNLCNVRRQRQQMSNKMDFFKICPQIYL